MSARTDGHTTVVRLPHWANRGTTAHHAAATTDATLGDRIRADGPADAPACGHPGILILGRRACLNADCARLAYQSDLAAGRITITESIR